MSRPTLAGILKLAIEGALDDVRVSLPGRVLAYDATRQCVDVQPLVMDRVENEDGQQTSVRVAVVNDVPVMFPGGGGCSETYPISKGDTVLLVFCSSAITAWKSRGGEVDPKDARHHQLSDAVAYAGVRDFAHPLANVPTNAWTITTPTGTQIRLGSASAAQAVILGDAFKTALNTMFAAMESAISGIAGGGAGAAAAITAARGTFNTAFTAALSSKVKVE